ncbi:Rz1-like lysis system protein LysC [Snodgrassella communis]|uniref:Rz1-like lysis system protein LysC n=1 Tax=Snodgrassella communis TaxID=2946699 RepID=UPI003FA70562
MNNKHKLQRLLKFLCTLMCVWMLQGCTSSTKPSAVASIPANLVEPCPALSPLNGSTGADILPWAVGVVGKYNDCARRHSALVKAIQ